MKKKSTSAAEFDSRLEQGEDISKYLGFLKGSRTGIEQKRVNIDFPELMLKKLDLISVKPGITRQSIIKISIANRLNEELKG
jgi:hypothetical protein